MHTSQSLVISEVTLSRSRFPSACITRFRMTSTTTAAQPKKPSIDKFIHALRDQGFLDQNFDALTNIHEDQNPLTVFCTDAERQLAQVEASLNDKEVDYPAVIAILDQVKANTSRVGGNRMAVACGELLAACAARSKQRSMEAFRKAIWEYYILRDCFHHIMQVKRTIYFSRGRRNQA